MTKITSTMSERSFEVKAAQIEGETSFLGHRDKGFEIEVKAQKADLKDLKTALDKVVLIVEGMMDVQNLMAELDNDLSEELEPTGF